MNLRKQTIEDLKALFPKTPQEIDELALRSIQSAQKSLEDIIALKPEERTFQNTAFALDQITAFSDFAITATVIEMLEYVHPDAAMRETTHNATIKIKNFFVDAVSNNKALYEAFKEYALGNANSETLHADQRYFIQETMDDFKRSGLDLSSGELEQIKKLNKDIATLEQNFEANIAADTRTITVHHKELAGLADDFINSLKRSENGDYIVGTDYPTYYTVMENCTVAKTRKKIWELFAHRAYPINDVILKELIAKRDELARALGFASFNHLNIDSQMAKTPERVTQFLQELVEKSHVKAAQEYGLFKLDLPEGVIVTPEGKFSSWDVLYTKNRYKKKRLQIDEQVIAEYFPMEHTIKGLLAIYEQFLSVRFEQQPISDLWHEDVQLITTYDKTDNALLGFLLLDLYPRPNKFSHACHATLIPATKTKPGVVVPEVSIVIANFPKSTDTKPSLLKRADVNTFFHEFGHAMHGLLGRTYLASQAGTHVKRDFVEMPSQMLEEWLWDKNMLKLISKHYKTGESLTDEEIEKILHLKHFDSGDATQRQVYFSFIALGMFASGEHKDPYLVQRELFVKIRSHVEFNPEDHAYASFGHLGGYASRYYGYLWSKVFALDLFDYIKKFGLLNPEIGKRYVDKVIGMGGSKDPNELLKDFLGREPNSKAFFADLGI